MTSNSGAALVKKGHPIRGILWGVMFGLGLTVVLVVTKVISLELSQMIIVLVVGIAAGVLWSLFGPARTPKGPAPVAAAGVATEEPPETVADGSTIPDVKGAGDSDSAEQGESPETATDEAAIGDGGDSDNGDSSSGDSDDGEWRSNT
ncbi:MAG: hypothetical protein V3U39_00080 [Acidimicrobiia bacterium]